MDSLPRDYFNTNGSLHSKLPWSWRCAHGAFYGIGRGIVEWMVRNVPAEYGYEDIVSCTWINKFDAARSSSASANRHGILPHTPEKTGLSNWLPNAWFHPLKD